MNTFYCPLVTFRLNRQTYKKFEDIVITKDIRIILNQDLPSLETLNNFLVQNKIRKYKKVSYWMVIEKSINEIEEIINILQLAFWIIEPTELQIHFYSNLNYEHKGRCLFSRFLYIPKHINYKNEYEYQDIEKLKTYYPAMLRLYENNRIHNSISFNFHGCITNSWEAAYILFSTTFESLLTHKNKWGTTKKLAWAYALLTETENENRQIAFENFRDIYNIRSEILHGESFNDKYKKSDVNLEELAKCRDMLRKLWQVILDSKETIEKLKLNDAKRRKYFKKVANGWIPKENNENKE